MEGDVHAYYSTCTRERTGSVLHGSRFSRYQAFGDRIIRSKSGSISLSQFSWLHCILLPQRRPENSEEALSAIGRFRLSASCPLAVLTARGLALMVDSAFPVIGEDRKILEAARFVRMTHFGSPAASRWISGLQLSVAEAVRGVRRTFPALRSLEAAHGAV